MTFCKNSLIEEMSRLPLSELDEVVKQAKKLAAEKKMASISKDEIERLRLAYKRLWLGQRIRYKANLKVSFDFLISAEHEYGGFEEINIKLDSITGRGAVWKDYIKPLIETELSLCIGENCATGVDDKIANACDEESRLYEKCQQMRLAFQDTYQIDAMEAFKLIEAE